jgi:hypothetical protein
MGTAATVGDWGLDHDNPWDATKRDHIASGKISNAAAAT